MNYQQNWDYVNKYRQSKPQRLHPQQQLLQRQQQMLQLQSQQNSQNYGESSNYQHVSMHQQQQQNYLNKIERAREQDEKQQEKYSYRTAARQQLLLNVDERQGAPKHLEETKSTLQPIATTQLSPRSQQQNNSLDNTTSYGMIRKSKSHKNKNNHAARKANKYSTSNYEANETQIINLPQINGANNSNNTISNTNSNTKKSGQVVNQVVRDVNGLQIVTEDHETVGVTSIRGLKPNNPNWNNQDNFFVSEKFDQRDIYLYCVLDGHGEVGHYVSRRCREQFTSFIKAANLDMKRAFNMMQNDLMSCDFDTRCSGATCVLICYMEGRLSVSNCGDSRAILGRRNSNGGYIAIPLSNDHKPDKPEERKRILNCGGHVGCRQVLVSQGPRGPVTMPVGPCRVWYQYKGDTLGLAMSRSLGDTIVHKSGVSAEPEILEHIVEEKDEFVIIATDGVWDVIDNNQAIQIIQNFVSKSQTPNWSALEASNWICKVARGRWEKLSPMVDDITCLVIKLK